MSALWSIDDMAKAMRAEKSGALPASVSGISIDSRTAEKDDAFFAIKGDARDGHEFVDAALKKGASLAVVSKARRGEFGDAPLLAVPGDVLDGLRDLATAARVRISKAKVIAVTGMTLRSAPILRMSCSWCMPWMTDPLPRNNSALKNAWVTMWKIAAT